MSKDYLVETQTVDGFIDADGFKDLFSDLFAGHRILDHWRAQHLVTNVAHDRQKDRKTPWKRENRNQTQAVQSQQPSSRKHNTRGGGDDSDSKFVVYSLPVSLGWVRANVKKAALYIDLNISNLISSSIFGLDCISTMTILVI